ncbi:amidohydrolase family protein [Nocardioides lijunqiniae]|uniref:amidohydrolase family protein n=1 Tax=Nocardioides lijunqiniae TaxID=2760832 RepID=UPI001878C8F4|nr:amidohydrolase family protein [Nocardioides lijunqiniae]
MTSGTTVAEPVAITHATLLPGDLAGSVRPRTTVLVDAHGLISAVGPTDEIDVPPGTRTIDATHRFVLPGLINAHAHLFSDGRPLPAFLVSPRVERLALAFLHSALGRRYLRGRTKSAAITQMNTGVTTIRSVGDPGYEVVEVGGAIERGQYLGPRLIASGPLLAIPGGHGAPQIALTATDAESTRTNVRRNLQHGVKAIKISATAGVTDAKEIGYAGRPEMSEANMRIICHEAHEAGVLVAAHAQSGEGIVSALRAGVDTIEHGAELSDEAIALFQHNPESLRGFSALIPTLMACLPLVKLDRSITGANPVARANAEWVLDGMLRGIRQCLDNDIPLGMGTDSALTFVTHYNTWRELDFLIRYGGLSPARALHAATQGNAHILGIEQVTGAIEEGRAADLLITDADPLDDIRALARPSAVLVRGRVIDSPVVEEFPEIDRLLDDF